MEVEGTTTPLGMLGGPNLLDLTRGSQRRTTDPRCTLELEQGQKQEQEQLLVAKLSDITSPQVQVEPLNGHLRAIWSTHTSNWSVEWLKKLSIPLDPFNQNLHCVSTSKSFTKFAPRVGLVPRRQGLT